MRKFLLTATILVPFAIAPAFAGDLSVAGKVDLSKTSAGSTAGVFSNQRTAAGVLAAGNGGVTVGTVSGNYTSIETTALGRAGPQGSFTDTTAQQVNVGGTISGGTAANKGWGRGATGIAGGSQTSQTEGGATASASNTSLSGSLKLDEPRGNGHGTGRGAR